MALYKYEYSEESGNWQMQEKRWGGLTEEQLYNHFDPNPDHYYVSAENYQQAENRLNQPLWLGNGETERFMMSQSQRSKAYEQLANVAYHNPDEVRREHYQELQSALGSDYNEYRGYHWSKDPSTNLPTADWHQKEAVRNELYNLNEFSPVRSVAILGYDDNPAETSHSFWQREQNSGAIAIRQKQDEPYTERESRDQVLAREAVVERSSDSAGISSNSSERNVEMATVRSHAFRSTNEQDNSWER